MHVPAMDPVKRMFHELREQNPDVRIRYHSKGEENHTERTMGYAQYRTWLANAQSNGFELEWVELVKK